MPADIKLSKAQISKIIQSNFWTNIKYIAAPLMKVAAPLAKNVLAPSGITAAASAMDAGTQKNTWLRNNNFNNFKRRKEWHNEICLSSSRF